MKCLKSVKQTKQTKLGEVIRTTDEDAIEKVKGGFWVYASKSEWKQLKQSPVEKVETKAVAIEGEVQVEKKKKGMSKKELKQEKKRNK